MALAGGVSGWVRAGLTALGVGLGVAMLLVAASVPAAAAARNARQAARAVGYVGAPMPAASATTIVVEPAHTRFRNQDIHGLRLQPDGAQPPLPPGVTAIPGPGQMVVSPALARLLASPEGALLRERLDYPIVGLIGDEGLSGPAELYFYLGADDLVVTGNFVDSRAVRIAQFGRVVAPETFEPVLSLIVVVVIVVLLLPVGLFVAVAIRFGGEARDRRLAGVRLLGADAGMARRIAAGEALASALLGLVVGAALFLLVRSFVDRLTINDISVFSHDLSPDPLLAVLLAVGVPAVAVLITIVSMRRVAIEPLGVARRSGDVRRRLWWRALLPALGVALVLPLSGDLARGDDVSEAQLGIGLSLILVGVAVLLPWLVQVTIGRLRGGSVAWQLAIRRMQLDASTPARAVMGIVVAVAGAVGLATVYGSVANNYVNPTGADLSRADAVVSTVPKRGWDDLGSLEESLRATPGVRDVRGSFGLTIVGEPSVDLKIYATLTVADCDSLRQFAALDDCAEGDVFLVTSDAQEAICGGGQCIAIRAPEPGERVQIELGVTVAAVPWTVPAHARPAPLRPGPDGREVVGVLATPSAVPVDVLAVPGLATFFLDLDRVDPDAVERLWTAVWRSGLGGHVEPLTTVYENEQFATLRRGLIAAATATLLLIGLSLLVSVVEQLRERRTVLAGLVAVGTPRRTLALSVLWQAVVPVALGLLLAVGAGTLVGTAVLKIFSEPVVYDWGAVAVVCGAAAIVVLGVTVLSLPVLWRLVRLDGLRTE
jgi:hypothetical protein